MLASEWADRRRRGFIASWPQWGAPAGLVLANAAVSGCDSLFGKAFLDWGWRVPFLASIVLLGVGLYIRVGVLETPAFARVLSQNRRVRAPAARLPSSPCGCQAVSRLRGRSPPTSPRPPW